MIQRSKGQSVVAASAYRRATRLQDQRLQKIWNYSDKPNVIHTEMMAPRNAPVWVSELVKLHETDPSRASEQLWNLVESFEKRVDAQLARELEFALPLELNVEQNIALARSFILDQCVLRGMIADWAVHWDTGNPHVHVLLTMRTLNGSGFGQRVRDWNSKALLLTLREQWAAYANFHLRLHHIDIQIDHRSYVNQGIDLIPGIHEGSASQSMQARGLDPERLEKADSIRCENLDRVADQPTILLEAIAKQQETFTDEDLGRMLERYVKSSNTAGDSSDVLTRAQISNILKTITHHESVFTEKDIAQKVAPLTDHADSFARAIIQIKRCKQLVSLGIGTDGQERFTTQTLFNVENSIQCLADKLRGSHHVKFATHHIDKLLVQYQKSRNFNLTHEQIAAVKHVVSSQSISCIVGRAGTGKSFCLGAANVIWQNKGLNVHGVALSGIAADGLAQGAGIGSHTIESFRYRVAQGLLVLGRRDVVVMDETGMTDSVSMLSVLKVVQAAGAKCVLVGDPAQLQPVGPGASFRALLERCGFVEINTVYRQKEAWQREATVAFSAGHISKGLAIYHQKGAIHTLATPEEAIDALTKDWLTALESSKDLSSMLVIAHRNSDVDQLNQKLRKARFEQEDRRDDYAVKTNRGKIKIAQGERLLFLKNDATLGVSNGRFGTIESIHFSKSNQVISFKVLVDGQKTSIDIDPLKYPDFTYGYGATVHKVQGITVDRAFVYVGGLGWNRHLTYVALSRHRKSCQLYFDEATHCNRRGLQRRLGRRCVKDSVLDFPLAFAERRGLSLENVLERLQTQLVKPLKQFRDKCAQQIQSWINTRSTAKQTTPEAYTINPEPDKAQNQKSVIRPLEAVLMEYVKMEIEQTRLMNLKLAAYTKDPDAVKELSEQTLQNWNALQVFVKHTVQHPEIQAAIKTSRMIKPMTIAQRGGFMEIYERLRKNELTPEDTATLIQQISNKATAYAQSQKQDRNRGRVR